MNKPTTEVQYTKKMVLQKTQEYPLDKLELRIPRPSEIILASKWYALITLSCHASEAHAEVGMHTDYLFFL